MNAEYTEQNGTESALSPLRMDHIVINRINFERKNFLQKNNDIHFQARKNIEQLDFGKYRVTLGVTAEKDDEYIAEIEISGYCTISEDHPTKDDLLQKNAIAILFPFIRAQLTLLTSQPETTPIVLPVMNINAMFDN